MLYASTGASLTKALGASYFPSSLFANSKSDLAPGAYTRHLQHLASPVPLSEREKELLAAREAERAAGASYEGARARVSPLQHSKGFKVDSAVDDAVSALRNATEGTLVIVNVDIPSETLVLTSSEPCTAASLASKLPSSSPAYAFFAHPLPDVAQTVFIYTCPSGSRVKERMLYSSQSLIFANGARSLLEGGNTPLAPRKIETSDVSSLDEAFLRHELIESDEAKAAARAGSQGSFNNKVTARGGGQGEVEEGGNVSSVRSAIAALEGRSAEANAPAPPTTGFARPKGPGRKR
jgi:twinfilin